MLSAPDVVVRRSRIGSTRVLHRVRNSGRQRALVVRTGLAARVRVADTAVAADVGGAQTTRCPCRGRSAVGVVAETTSQTRLTLEPAPVRSPISAHLDRCALGSDIVDRGWRWSVQSGYAITRAWRSAPLQRTTECLAGAATGASSHRFE